MLFGFGTCLVGVDMRPKEIKVAVRKTFDAMLRLSSIRHYLERNIAERESLRGTLPQIEFTYPYDAHSYRKQNDAFTEISKKIILMNTKIEQLLTEFTNAQNEYIKCFTVSHQSKLRGHRRYKKKAEREEKRITVETC